MNIKKLTEYLQAPSPEYGTVPFWFLNHYAEEAEVRKQIRDFASKHCGGIMLHARDGLLGGYLNSHWEETVSWALDEAKKQGIGVWLYDELNYPSGPAGGKIFDVCPETSMQSLELVKESETPPEETFDKVLKFEGKYLCFNIQHQRQYPDYLDRTAMKEFVKLSYTWYADRFKKDFGTLIRGEFTDNSCANFGYYRRSIPWTPRMPELFREKYGLDLEDVLPSLFYQTNNHELHRILFWRFLNELYLESFVIPIEEECSGNGIASTGHYCIETGISEHVRQLGDRFDQKLHQHLPGVDMLGARTWKDFESFPIGTASAMLANTASPAYFFHGSRVLCECMGLSLRWGMTLAEMRRVSGALASLGVDLFVPHGFYYSVSGHRKRECIPDFYHNTMWKYLDAWSLWIRRLCALTSCAEEHLADTALLYPVTSQQASIELGLGERWKDRGIRCDRIDTAWSLAGDVLVQNAIPYEILNETLLCSAEVCGPELRIALPRGGYHRIHNLILSSIRILGKETYEKLLDFADQGGCIIGLEETVSEIFTGNSLEQVTPPPNFYTAHFPAGKRETLQNSRFLSVIRQHGKVSRLQLENGQNALTLREWLRNGQYFAMIHNFTRNKISGVKITCSFDPVTVNLDPLQINRTGRIISKDFEYGETLILTECDGAAEMLPQKKIREEIPFAVKEWQVDMEGPNALVLTEMKCISHPAEPTRKFEWNFYADSLPENIGIALDMEPTPPEMRNGQHPFMERYENCRYIRRCDVRINGKQVRDIRFGTRLDRWIYEGDILPFIVVGLNKIELEQPCEILEKNRTFPEPVLLIGNFGVQEGRIVKAPEKTNALRWDDTILKNYSGTMRFTSKITIPEQLKGKTCCLHFQDVHEILEVRINGKNCGSRVMPPWDFQIPGELLSGEEMQLELLVTNTPSNRWQEQLISGISGQLCWEIFKE